MRAIFLLYAMTTASLVSSLAFGEDLGGLKTSVSVDTNSQFGLSKGSEGNDRISVREAELLLYSPADHMFDGQLNVAAHSEGGVMHLEVHEAYLGSSKLIPRSRFRLGHFFLGVGRINQIHRHDWPFTTAPRYHREFFAYEGAQDTGLEYTYLFPLPFFLEVTAGLTNGYVFGHDHSTGSKPKTPTHYARAVTYFSMPGEGGAQLGLNYLGRTDNAGTKKTLAGLDFTAKWREAQVLKYLIQAEAWHQWLNSTRQWGFYLFPQAHIGDGFYVGARLDYYTDTSLTYGGGGAYPNGNLTIVPSLLYRSSEFVTARLSLTQDFERQGTTTQSSQMIEFQAVFFLGAHPAHDF
ncbi:TonB-dependent receptor [bacterium]|nr:TonB-dependent receptor [bacterium]